MKMPRLSISGLMAVVLVVALDFGLGKAIFQFPFASRLTTELLMLGAFPMANVLAVGLAILVVSRRDSRRRTPALSSFLAFGFAAWLTFVAGSTLAPNATNLPFISLVKLSGLNPGLGLAALGVIAFILPQLAFASLGWWLVRRAESRRSLTRKADVAPAEAIPL